MLRIKTERKNLQASWNEHIHAHFLLPAVGKHWCTQLFQAVISHQDAFTKPKTKGTKIGQLIKAVSIFIIPFSLLYFIC